jgi:hypothetical protein
MSTTATAVAPEAPLTFEVTDVTESYQVTVSDVQRDLPAGAVAQTLAARLSLAEDVPWALRDDATGAFLEDDRAIGDQLTANAHVTITPKTHLGG